MAVMTLRLRARAVHGASALAGLLLLGPPLVREGHAASGAAVHAGTAGVGAAWAVELGGVLDLRLLANYGGLTYRDTMDDIDYDIELDLRSAGVLLDWFPGGGAFRVSGGLFHNGNELRGEARPRSATTIGRTSYTPEQIGTLRASIDFPGTAWYLGLGAGRIARGGRRLTLTLDLGALLYGDPDFSLSADGAYAGREDFRTELERERRDIERDYVDRWAVHPVVAVGLAYRF